MLFRTGLLVALLLSVVFPIFSAPEAQARLVAEDAALVPGSTTTVAVVIRLPEGWYTYWQNPGDSGLPVRIQWTHPAGVTVSALSWPVPSVFGDPDAATYGFTGEVVLLADLQIPRVSPVGSRLAVSARVDWLLCKDACVPGGAAVRLELPVVAVSRRATGSSRALFQRARERLPEGQAPLSGVMRERGAQVEFVFRGAPLSGEAPGYWFPEDGSLFAAPGRQDWRREGGAWVLRLAKAPAWKRPATPVRGVLRAAGTGAAPAWRVAADWER